MCATLLGRRHLVNAYEMNAGWLIPFGALKMREWKMQEWKRQE